MKTGQLGFYSPSLPSESIRLTYISRPVQRIAECQPQQVRLQWRLKIVPGEREQRVGQQQATPRNTVKKRDKLTQARMKCDRRQGKSNTQNTSRPVKFHFNHLCSIRHALSHLTPACALIFSFLFTAATCFSYLFICF